MSKLWMTLLPAIFSFGPMFMTNMGGHGSSGFDFVVSLGAALMVGFGLISMFKRMNKQDELIKEMQSQIGGSNEQTASS